MLTRFGVEQLYCQNLCLFAKLFIEHKYMFFDVSLSIDPTGSGELTLLLETGRRIRVLPLD